MSRPRIELGSQELASCAITARPPQHDTTGPRHRAFDVFQGSCYSFRCSLPPWVLQRRPASTSNGWIFFCANLGVYRHGKTKDPATTLAFQGILLATLRLGARILPSSTPPPPPPPSKRNTQAGAATNLRTQHCSPPVRRWLVLSSPSISAGTRRDRSGFANSSKFKSRSFRIGAATTAAEVGVPAWLIKTMGCWSSQV